MSDSNFIDDSDTVKSRGREKRRTMRTGKQTKKRSGSETGHVKGLGNSLGYGFCTYCRPYLAIRQTNKQALHDEMHNIRRNTEFAVVSETESDITSDSESDIE